MATNVFVNNQPPPTTTLITVQSNQWSTGICDCFDDLNVCCFGFWCFPFFACTTASEFGECFCLPLLDLVGMSQMCGIPTCIPPASMSMRVAVRHRYKIQGDLPGDCVYATFCNVCSWCQMAREIKRRKNVIIAQPVQISPQQYIVASQPGIISSQPVIATAPPGVVTATLM